MPEFISKPFTAPPLLAEPVERSTPKESDKLHRICTTGLKLPWKNTQFILICLLVSKFGGNFSWHSKLYIELFNKCLRGLITLLGKICSPHLDVPALQCLWRLRLMGTWRLWHVHSIYRKRAFYKLLFPCILQPRDAWKWSHLRNNCWRNRGCQGVGGELVQIASWCLLGAGDMEKQSWIYILK